MITPSQASPLIAGYCTTLPSIILPLDRALGYVLARDVRLRHPLPLFDNSAMDGYALRSSDTLAATSERPVRLPLSRAIYAGDTSRPSLPAGGARPIMTGAPVPRGADTIVPIEAARVEASQLVVNAPVPLRHVRRRGEDVAKGTVLVEGGTVIHPGVVACIAAAGIDRVRVIRRPSVSVIATGSETVAPGAPLLSGQIYDSNSHMIAAALRHMGIGDIYRRRVKDHPAAVEGAMRAALGRSEVVVVIGGVSVGERDYVRGVLKRLRVKQVFWRVAQKPGKPLYFGVRGRSLVFGLPGNPASAFTCFYVHVYPAIRRLAGYARAELAAGDEAITGDFSADSARWRFLKARSKAGSVSALSGQGSHMIASLARADRLVVVPPGEGGEDGASILRLPFAEDDS